MDYSYQSLELYIVPLRSDNYSYVIHEKKTGQTLVIDPSEGEPLIRFLQERKLGLDFIYNTHHHNDHTEGNTLLQKTFGSKILASSYDIEKERIPGTVSAAFKDGDRLTFSGFDFQVLATPGHTLGHVCLFFEGANWLFCGDTLFALGCGRLFEGTPAIMWESFKKLRALPDDTLRLCGHEYTLANARFANHVLPKSKDLDAYIAAQIERKKAEGRTVPSRLGDEKLYNPFFLADQPALKTRGTDPIAAFAAIRKDKDNFS